MDIVSSASEFLNNLERVVSLGEQLPLPYLMERISDLLKKLLDEEIRIQENTPDRAKTGEEGWPERSGIRPVETYDGGYSSAEGEMWNGHGTADRDRQYIQKFEEALDSIAATTTPIYLDVQFLNSETGYVTKEFAALSPGVEDVAWITIKTAPGLVPMTVDNGHFTTNVHGLDWDIGAIGEDQLRAMTAKIFTAGRLVYVKGFEKKDIVLKKLDLTKAKLVKLDPHPKLRCLRNQYDMEPCPLHLEMLPRYACSVKHVRVLEHYYSRTEDRVEEEECWDT